MPVKRQLKKVLNTQFYQKALQEAFVALDNECFKNFNEIKSDFNSEIEFKNDSNSLDDYNILADNNLKFVMTVAVAGKHNLLTNSSHF